MSAPPAAPEKPSHRRDLLLDIERRVQQQWEAAHIWEADAGDAATRQLDDKYLATFPYPYMNGVLHLGHGFTLAKVDFECAYQRLKGKNVLFPFGYHCTGMPICAAAEKLKREIAQFGNPPQFPQPKAAEESPEAMIDAVQLESKEESKDADSGKKKDDKKGGRSKVASKASKETYQWNILREMGVPEGLIANFQDARYWLGYFPPIATRDLKRFGLSADFRRSFITTDANPYYDSFIRWHFNTLRRRDKIAFGGRLSIFSPIDGQTCADHDRAEGEGVDLTEYTLIKMALQQPYPAAVAAVVGAQYADRAVYLPAATLRPETMYGQTNLWVLPEGEYGVFAINDRELFICSPKSALNMAYQNLSPKRGQVERIGTVSGKDLLGAAVSAPYAKYDKVYCLPLTTIKMDKGTAVVTSVPSDAPDDWAAFADLKNKPAFREKFGITDDMILPFEVVQIIETPGLGMQPAVDLCIEKKVASQNDRVKLEEIKDKVYKEGFAKGIMRVGEYSGMKVSDAKPKIKADMINAGLAYNYAEPDKRVVSRSGNECVVALADQWYLKYGESEWQSVVRKHVDSTLELYNPQTKKDFQLIVEWLHEWACSRSFGLGTCLPWDPQYVIESLSDSTIYMAYYTIAHLLQGPQHGDGSDDTAAFLNGARGGLAGIAAADLTDDVWNYILLNKEFPAYPADKTCIPQATLDRLRNEFEYWYPLDLRVSGKDLIGNHLTMSLYNHTAVWPDEPSKWPRSFFTNGHVMIDSAKMSKSTGNFITLADAVKEYSADATRFALADAGDGLEDANFERKSANAAILKLTKEEAWLHEVLAWDEKNPATPLRTGSLNFFDQAFLNELAHCVAQADVAYSRLQFREALKYAWHQLQIERDLYKLAVDAEKQLGHMHRDVLHAYFRTSAILLAPICPHFAQHVWEVTGEAKQSGVQFVAKASWSSLPSTVDPVLQRQAAYLRDAASTLRRGLIETLVRFGKAPKPKAGEKAIVIEPWVAEIAKAAEGGMLVPDNVAKLLTHATLYIADSYPEWQVAVLKLVSSAWDELGRRPDALPDRKLIIPRLKSLPTASVDKKALENSTKFANSVLEDLAVRGAAALELQSPFSERALLEAHRDFVLRDLGLPSANVEIRDREQGPTAPAPAASSAGPAAALTPEQMALQVEVIAVAKALPGRPSPYFYKK